MRITHLWSILDCFTAFISLIYRGWDSTMVFNLWWSLFATDKEDTLLIILVSDSSLSELFIWRIHVPWIHGPSWLNLLLRLTTLSSFQILNSAGRNWHVRAVSFSLIEICDCPSRCASLAGSFRVCLCVHREPNCLGAKFSGSWKRKLSKEVKIFLVLQACKLRVKSLSSLSSYKKDCPDLISWTIMWTWNESTFDDAVCFGKNLDSNTRTLSLCTRCR